MSNWFRWVSVGTETENSQFQQLNSELRFQSKKINIQDSNLKLKRKREENEWECYTLG